MQNKGFCYIKISMFLNHHIWIMEFFETMCQKFDKCLFMRIHYFPFRATWSIFYPKDRYKDASSPFIYDKTKKNTKCLTYLKNHRNECLCTTGLHSRNYKNHRHKMIRHTKLIDHILRLPSLNATLQFMRLLGFKESNVLIKVAYFIR